MLVTYFLLSLNPRVGDLEPGFFLMANMAPIGSQTFSFFAFYSFFKSLYEPIKASSLVSGLSTEDELYVL